MIHPELAELKKTWELTSPLFGQISGSANARIIQFALKYNF
jgi:hypothetical protein